MERVEQFQSIKVGHCTLSSVLRSVTFDFMLHKTSDKVRILIDEVVRKIAQKCEVHIYGES